MQGRMAWLLSCVIAIFAWAESVQAGYLTSEQGGQRAVARSHHAAADAGAIDSRRSEGRAGRSSREADPLANHLGRAECPATIAESSGPAARRSSRPTLEPEQQYTRAVAKPAKAEDAKGLSRKAGSDVAAAATDDSAEHRSAGRGK